MPLPSHLSHKAALVLIPPASISSPIQSLRKIHDRNFNRWPPHINLIYPFLSTPSSNVDTILARIKTAIELSYVNESFALRLDASDHFQHSRDSSTVYLTSSGTQPESRMASVKALQKALQHEFSECNADIRAYVPHLSIGQAKRVEHVEGLKDEIEATMRSFCQTELEWGLAWLVDRITVIEREGQHDPFRIMGEVLL